MKGNREWLLLFICILFRWGNSLIVVTQFDPDEFWQALEPAKKLSFGTGHLTWEWHVAIRSWLLPWIYSIPMWIGKALQISDPYFYVYFPRMIIQGTMCGIGDYATYSLAKRISKSGEKEAAGEIALILITTNWFQFYCGVRAYSNSFEASVTILILAFFWPLPSNNNNNNKENNFKTFLGLLLASVSIIVRPTSLVTWMYFGFIHLVFHTKNAALLLMQVFVVALLSIGLMVMVDYFGYHRVVLSLWNFGLVNFSRSDIAASYGVHSFHWYFTQCFPAILGVSFPLFVFTMVAAMGKRSNAAVRLCVGFVVCSLLVLSISPHKELRFALPYLSPAIACVGATMRKKINKIQLFVISLSLNVIPALYLSIFHQSEGVEMAFYLNQLPKAANHPARVDVLLNCHSIPNFSHVHRNDLELTFVDCTPFKLLGNDAISDFEPALPFRRNDAVNLYRHENEWLQSNPQKFFEYWFQRNGKLKTPHYYVVTNVESLRLLNKVLQGELFGKKTVLLHQIQSLVLVKIVLQLP